MVSVVTSELEVVVGESHRTLPFELFRGNATKQLRDASLEYVFDTTDLDALGHNDPDLQPYEFSQRARDAGTN
jgi:hypothetical protein